LTPDIFFYPEKGIGTLAARLAEAIENAGGRIHFNSKPLRIKMKERKAAAVDIEEDGIARECEVDYIVSTIPVNQLPFLIQPAWEAKVLEAASKLKFRALILIYLLLDRDRVSEDHWFFFPEEKYMFSMMFEQKSFSRLMVPPGKTVLCLDLTCRKGDEVWRMSDDELLKLVVPQLEETRLIRGGEVRECFTVRFDQVYPLYELGYEENLNIVLDAEAEVENLITNGRLGLFNYNNMDHCMEMGISAAEHILSGKSKSDSWVVQRRRFNEYKIID
jgi:protoporphyrinogen oxidase